MRKLIYIACIFLLFAPIRHVSADFLVFSGATYRSMQHYFSIRAPNHRIFYTIALFRLDYLNIKDYYSNIKKLGLEYEELDYSKSLEFLLMTVSGIEN